MTITQTALQGVYLIKREPKADSRGAFTRVLCKRNLETAGLCGDIAQINLSANIKKATLRGLHAQRDGDAEDKIVTCIAGSVFDVAVDVRKDSPNFGRWIGETLSAGNGYSLYVPKGFAHGYLTLTDDAQVMYFVTQFYKPGAELGFRWDDPAFGIDWPARPLIISEKDRSWPLVRGE